MGKILIVEDEPDLAQLIKGWLSRDHHLVETVGDGLEALALMESNKYDVIVLDIVLPSMDGFDVCKRYRRGGGSAGIIILTAKTHVDDKERGLDNGADDYITKPFQLKELAARVRSVLRRNHRHSNCIISFRDLEIDEFDFKVTKAGSDVHLVRQEFRLLTFFLKHPQQVFSAEDLLARVWESETTTLLVTVRGHIRRLRKKLDSEGRQSVIETVYGTGYRLGKDFLR